MTSVKMDWKHLLNRSRLGHLQGRQRPDSDDPDIRSAFLRDYDRIVFSTAFRRLQGKTQVFPIPETDMIHTRLSHSLEVACVGRSLGATVARDIEAIAPSGDDVASIVSAACLAHDIGNPPFGHAGEAAIAHYFRHGPGIDIVNDFPADQKGDFVDFEGKWGQAPSISLEFIKWWLPWIRKA